MTELGCLFTAPMVRAILEGRKTQTRRILKRQPAQRQPMVIDITEPFQDEAGVWGQVETVWSRPLVSGMCEPEREKWHPLSTPCAVGDVLWVRETWGVGTRPCPVNGWRDGIEYRADDDGSGGELPLRTVDADLSEIKGGWRPSIHMFRWASRITLRVTDVRVQRLQEISEYDAIAEGVEPLHGFWRCYGNTPAPFGGAAPTVLSAGRGVVSASPIHSYATLWNSINGPGAWEANPWVAAITFERVGGRNG